MKLSIKLLLAMMATSANGQYINPIIDKQQEGVYYSTATLIENKLFYQTQKNEFVSLWSMDLATKNKEKLIDSYYDAEFDEDTEAIDYIEPFRDKVYFSHSNQQYRRFLWITDGTSVGTQRVNDTRLNSGGRFGIFNNELFAENVDSQLIQLKNETFVTHDVKFPSLINICVFAENDFVVQSRNAAADTFTLNRVRGSSVTEIYTYTPTSDDDSSTVEDEASFASHNNSCLFTHTAAGERKVISVPQNGEAEMMPRPEGVSPIRLLLNHQGQIFIFTQNDDSTDSGIHRLSPDLSEVEASIDVIDNYIFITSISSENQLLAVEYEINNSFSRSKLVFYDSDLNLIPTYDNNDRNLIRTKYITSSGVVTLFNDDHHDAIIQTIDRQNNVALSSINNHFISEAISHPSTDDLYLVLFDRTVRKNNIYSLRAQPSINDAINGTWHEYDIANQGLVIQNGTRHDGSDYLFATLYVFDQGQPLWLAGVSEITLDQQNVEIQLYRYDGIQMFEYEADPDQTPFGQLSIDMSDCNTINITINSEWYNQSLPLYRIDDTSYQHLCTQVKPVGLSGQKNQLTVMDGDDQ